MSRSATPSQVDAAVKVVKQTTIGGAASSGMHKVSIVVKLSKFDTLKKALNDLGVTGMTVTQVMGCGIQKGAGEYYRGVEMDATLLPKVKVDVIIGNLSVDAVVEAAKKALYTGHIGDGKIFVYDVAKVVKVRDQWRGSTFAALKDVGVKSYRVQEISGLRSCTARFCVFFGRFSAKLKT